ncbi:MAG: DNA-binding transcriptional regulator [Terriglobia bacterium]|jgi:LacI family transcriptional regulator, galactose operon repressor
MTKIRAITGMPQVALLLETSTEFGRGLLRGIVRYSHLHGPWSLCVAPGHLEQSLPKAKSWSGSGIIARMRSPEMAKQIRATGLPFVASSLDEFRLPRRGDKFGEIRTNSAAIARMAATHLMDQSLRHFAFCGFHGCAWSSCREEVFSHCLNDQGFECHTHRIELGNWMHLPNWIEDWELEQRILLDWLKSLPKPVGLMACNDICGREVLQACAAAGLRVPDDVAVVGVDNDELMCELSTPSLSSIALDVEKAGYEAARLLDSLMSGHLGVEQVVQVEPVYVVTRQSSEVMTLDDPSVAAALRFIKDHAAQPIAVSHVIERVGVSRRTLERRFARVLSRSISSAITQCRLERAKRLLLETDLPSYRVAAGAGFGTIKTFNRIFRRAAGVSPKHFRQSAPA